MQCVACGAGLVAGKAFCPMCGTRAALQCGVCGGTLEPQFRFCPTCGTPVAATAAAPVAAAPAAQPAPASPAAATLESPAVPTPAPADGERKQVTVLFCDLVGSTAIAERLDPEEYREIIDRYLERVFPEIYRYAGIVNTLAGDGLMAIFGAPVAHEDDPRRAVRAALAIRDTLANLATTIRAERAVELQARIGVHTGPVVVGTVGNSFKMDYTAIGDTTNLAARLQTLAQPGSILISESTYRLVRGFFAVEPTGPLDVRGKSEPVLAYEVKARVATTPISIAAERGLTPLVGRAQELARLEAAWARVATERLGIVAVVGEAGIGKSRLVYEFRHRLDGQPVTFFEGRCSSMNQMVPYHPMLSMLRHFFALVPDDSAEAAQEKLATKLGLGYGHVERMFPLLSRFLALPGGSTEIPADAFKREITDAIAALVLGTQGPVVLVVEDTHWIDESSRELMEALLGRLAHAPVLVVVTHRPDADKGWRVRTGVEKIKLERLDREDVTTIFRAIAGGTLPPELETTLVGRASGSPFFAEELARVLVEGGHLEKTATGMRLARPLAEVPIPGTIHEVVAARLDRLRPAAKRVLQMAAVLGRQFGRTELAAVLAGEDVDIDRELEELVRRGILHGKLAGGGDELRFGESLTQEIAYEGLLLRQRRLLHERVARHLDAQPAGGGPERSALRAHHWARSDNRGRAAEALLAAAHDAESVPSYRAAAEFYQRAWEAAEAASGEFPDDRFLRMALDATAALGRIVVFFGLPYVEAAARAVERGRELAEYFHDTEATASFYYMIGVMKMTRDGADYAAGLAVAERGLALADAKGLRLASIRIGRGLCLNYTIDGRFAQAQQWLDRVLPVLAASEDPEHPSDLYLSIRWSKEVLLYASDDLDGTVAHVNETLALGARVHNRTIRCVGSAILAQTHCLRGEYAEAKRLADESLALGEEIGNLNVFPAAASIALLARAELGEQVDPAHYVECIEKGVVAAGFMQLNVRFVTEALLAVGDVAEAERHAVALWGAVGGRLRQGLVGVAYGDVMQRLGRWDEAIRGYESARAIAEEIGARSTLAGALLGRAEVAAARGDFVDPAAIEQARALCAELGLHRYAPRIDRVALAATQAVAAS